MAEKDELYLLYPPVYERRDGRILGEHWQGRDVPVPPDWVKSRVRLPPGCENACLAKEIEKVFPEATREILVDYVKSWDRVREYGYHLVIAGSGVTYKRRQWAASAVINEIIMRFGQTQDIGSEWVNVHNARQIVDMKVSRFDSYSALRSRLIGAKLLFMEDPFRVSPTAPERYFIEDIYKSRADRLRPTITTVSGDSTDKSFFDVKTILGETVQETFQIYAKWIAPL